MSVSLVRILCFNRLSNSFSVKLDETPTIRKENTRATKVRFSKVLFPPVKFPLRNAKRMTLAKKLKGEVNIVGPPRKLKHSNSIVTSALQAVTPLSQRFPSMRKFL